MEQVGIQVAACGFEMLVLLRISHPESETLCIVVGDQRMMRGGKMCIISPQAWSQRGARKFGRGHDPGMGSMARRKNQEYV